MLFPLHVTKVRLSFLYQLICVMIQNKSLIVIGIGRMFGNKVLQNLFLLFGCPFLEGKQGTFEGRTL